MGWLAWRSGGRPGFLTRFMLLLLLWVLSSSSTESVLLGTARPGRVPGVRQTWGHRPGSRELGLGGALLAPYRSTRCWACGPVACPAGRERGRKEPAFLFH
ncbi:uncharacterized protein J3D65DRAFT_639424 [Phyllosticta citribraziliensis]|uniref:Uncharacterized protein n=1 Tax=Phyllosticta citribraziliensis TaxID=989973 RepID=A0ABR1L8K2_9PEZI